MKTQEQLSESLRRDLRRATEVLQEHGCTEVFLFGSLANGEIHDRTDLDLAVRGCPKGEYFRILGQLLLELDNGVDLVLLDREDPFGRFLQEEGELVRVA
jgi:predicted nucleotidyltransferase